MMAIRLSVVFLVMAMIAIYGGSSVPNTVHAQGPAVDLEVSIYRHSHSPRPVVLEVFNHGNAIAEGVRVVIESKDWPLDADNNDIKPLVLPVGKLVPGNSPYQAVWEIGQILPQSGYILSRFPRVTDSANSPSPRPEYHYLIAVAEAPQESRQNLHNNRAVLVASVTSSELRGRGDLVVEADIADAGGKGPGDNVSFAITARLNGHDKISPGVMVDVQLPPGLTYSAHTITQTDNNDVVSADTDTSYDANSGKWNIGYFDVVTVLSHYTLMLTANIAADAVPGEQCLTAEISSSEPEELIIDGSLDDSFALDGSLVQANNVAKVCLDQPELVSDGELSLWLPHSCVNSDGTFPCTAEDSLLVVSEISNRIKVSTPGEPTILVHVDPVDGAVFDDHAASVNDANTVSWRTARNSGEDGVHLKWSRKHLVRNQFNNVDEQWISTIVAQGGDINDCPSDTDQERVDITTKASGLNGASAPGRVEIRYTSSGNRFVQVNPPGARLCEWGNKNSSLWGRFAEFEKLGTYLVDFTVSADHSDGNHYSGTNRAIFHVGPIAELEVSDGGASKEAGPDQVAFTVNAVNNGPDHALGAVVDIGLTLPEGVTVADAIASQGTYDETKGEWDLGALWHRYYRRGAGLSDAATLTIILKGEGAQFAEASATIRNDNANHPYTVCLEVDHGHIEDVDEDNRADCEAHGGSWHEGTMFDNIDGNNKAALRAHYGAGKRPAEEAKPFVAVTWQAVEGVNGFPVSHYQVWRSACDDQEPATMAAEDMVADDVSETGWVDLDVDAEQTYCYRVRAMNYRGEEGLFSRIIERKAREPLAPKVSPAGTPDRPVLSAAPLEDQPRERILLTWDKPNENGWPILSYTLEASDRSGGPWTPVKIEPVPGRKEYTYIYPSPEQERLTGGTRKYFRLQATNEQGNSEWSRVVSATTERADLAGPPVNVFARPAAPPDDGSVIIVYWEPPAYDGGADITGYEVQWSPNGESGWRYAGRVDKDTLAFKNAGLGYGTTRYYRVAAHNSRGRGAWSSETVAAVTSAKEEGASLPGAPTNLRLEAGSQWIRASWDAPASDGGSPIKGYRVQYREGRSGAWETLSAFPSGTSQGLTGIPNGVEYQVRVAAVNGAGTGPYTTPQSATPYYPPGTPRNLSVTPGNGRLTAKWDPPEIPGNPNLNGYSVQYRYRELVNEQLQWTGWKDRTHHGTGTETTITNLTNDREYQVRVASLSAPLLLAAAKGKEIDYTAAVSATPKDPSQ